MKTTAAKLVKGLIENLWQQYLRRVSYARVYSDLVTAQGGKVVHDHLAFRTLNTHTGEQPSGITAIGHLLEMLNYEKCGKYKFPKMMVSAVHYEHPDPFLPKIFVSQLEVEELPEWARQVIQPKVNNTPYLLSDQAIELMNILSGKGTITNEAAEILIEELTGYFRRPWRMPLWEDLLKINDVSQYAAWTMIHGNSVNHFAALVNMQNVEAWPGIEATCRAMADAGVPMKDQIEGDRGSYLRQSSTHAVRERIKIRDDSGELTEKDWTYAYYELTERGNVLTDAGEKLYSGFITDQATHLFRMTETREN